MWGSFLLAVFYILWTFLPHSAKIYLKKFAIRRKMPFSAQKNGQKGLPGSSRNQKKR